MCSFPISGKWLTREDSACDTLLWGMIYKVLQANDSNMDLPLIQYLLEIAQQVVNGDPSIGSFFLTTDDSGTLEVEGSWA